MTRFGLWSFCKVFYKTTTCPSWPLLSGLKSGNLIQFWLYHYSKWHGKIFFFDFYFWIQNFYFCIFTLVFTFQSFTFDTFGMLSHFSAFGLLEILRSATGKLFLCTFRTRKQNWKILFLSQMLFENSTQIFNFCTKKLTSLKSWGSGN